jgi:hypothetical protein
MFPDTLRLIREVTFADANRSLGEMVAAMVGIVESSQQISTIIKVIDEIVVQAQKEWCCALRSGERQ